MMMIVFRIIYLRKEKPILPDKHTRKPYQGMEAASKADIDRLDVKKDKGQLIGDASIGFHR